MQFSQCFCVVNLGGKLQRCNFYDFWNVQVRNETEWSYAKNPLPGVGLDAIVAYARAHGKGVWFGEWGGHSASATIMHLIYANGVPNDRGV